MTVPANIFGLLLIDPAAKHIIDDHMDEDESHWVEEPSGPSGSRLMDEDEEHDENMEGSEAMSPEEKSARGANSSLIHVDWMIGSDQIDLDGIKPDGSAEPLMRAGEWV